MTDTAIESSSPSNWLSRLHQWREEHISERMFVLILAFFVGFFSAVAAFVLHWLINQIVSLLTSSFDASSSNWLYLVYPVVGIYITSLFVRYVVKDNISHGITRILYAISQNRSRLKPHNTWSSVISSAITIGFGGSVGAEAPIVLTGSAIGSNLGKLFFGRNYLVFKTRSPVFHYQYIINNIKSQRICGEACGRQSIFTQRRAIFTQ